jgi:Arc/MetJ family transcription regulator
LTSLVSLGGACLWHLNAARASFDTRWSRIDAHDNAPKCPLDEGQRVHERRAFSGMVYTDTCILVYDQPMGRTNIVVNDRLIARVMRLYGLRTKREAVDFALRRVAGTGKRRDILGLEGAGWEGDLEAMRRWREPGE